jgi:hypothetical protein
MSPAGVGHSSWDMLVQTADLWLTTWNYMSSQQNVERVVALVTIGWMGCEVFQLVKLVRAWVIRQAISAKVPQLLALPHSRQH